MADEIRLSFTESLSLSTLTFKVFRTIAGVVTLMTGPTQYKAEEPANSGEYVGDYAAIQSGDTIRHMYNSIMIASEVYQPDVDLSSLHNFNPDSDDVAVVTLVETTTINTDMRGTNDAATEVKQDIIDANVDHIHETTEDDGGVRRFTEAALAEAPTAEMSESELHSALDNYTATGGTIKSIVDDTDDLQDNQGNWLTAIGFSTHNAASVWAVTPRSLTTFGSLVADIAIAVWGFATKIITGSNKDSEIDDIKVQTDKMQFDDNDNILANTGEADSSGLDFTYTVLDSETGLPLSGAKVNIYADEDGSQLFASNYANSLGVARFKIDAPSGTTLYVGVIKSGYSEYDSLDIEMLTDDEESQSQGSGTLDPGTLLVYSVSNSSNSQPVAGAKINAYADSLGATLVASAYTNVVGVATMRVSLDVGDTVYVGVIKLGYDTFDSLDAVVLTGIDDPIDMPESTTFEYTVTDSITGDPVFGAVVTVYMDLEGTLRVNSDTTDSFGEVSFLVGLSSGTTVYVGIAASGYAENEELDILVL